MAVGTISSVGYGVGSIDAILKALMRFKIDRPVRPLRFVVELIPRQIPG